MKENSEIKKPSVIFFPNQRGKQNWIKTWIVLIGNIVNSRDLIIQLFKRDFLMAYKKSFLGMSWIILTPILGIISWVIMNATGIINPGDVGIPYPAYVLLSTSIYALFMNFFTGAAGTLTAGSGFILQVNFAHDILLIKQLLQQFAGFAISFILTIVILFVFGVVPSWMIILFPLLIIPMMMLGAAIGLVTSIINVVATDIQKAITFLMTLLMYITPVIYSSNVSDPMLQRIIRWNPLTYLIGAVRDTMIYGKYDHWYGYLLSSLLSLILFLVSWRLFYVSEQKVIEKMI